MAPKDDDDDDDGFSPQKNLELDIDDESRQSGEKSNKKKRSSTALSSSKEKEEEEEPTTGGGGDEAPKKKKHKKKKKKKMDAEPTDPGGKIHFLLQTQCRPFGLQQIAEVCGVEKGVAQALLEGLVSSKVALTKTIGNQKVFWSGEIESETTAEVEAAREETERAIEAAQKAEAQVAALTKTTSTLSAQPLNENLDAILEDLAQKEAAIRTKLESVGARGTVTKPQMNKAAKQHNDMLQTWVKRKRACKDLVDTLAENLDKKPKEILKALDDYCSYETDENNNVSLPPPKPLPIDKKPPKKAAPIKRR